MAQLFDPYDPEEKRRRELLSMGDPNDTQVPQLGSALDDDEGDAETAQSSSSMAVGGGKLTPAQQKYRETVEAAPDRANFKPSGWRRFGAALAGGLTGIKNPELGVKVAQDTLNAPYEYERQNWADRVNKQALSMGLDKEVAAQDIARQRALAYQQSANARTAAAQRAGQHYNWLESQPKKYVPTTQAEYERQLQMEHPGRAPTKFEEFSYDPDTYGRMVEAENRGKPHSLTVEEQMRLQRQRDDAAMARAKVRGQSVGKAQYPSMTDQMRAEQFALQRVLRTGGLQHPEYSKFIMPGDPTRRIADRPKRPDEIPQDLLTQTAYKRFLLDLENEKRQLLNSSRGSGGAQSQWFDPEDEENQEEQ